jgi:cation diffusion facilitator family transporter
MKRNTSFHLIPDFGDVKDPDIRAKYGYLEATVSIIGNSCIFLIKFILGLFINSIALIADGIHSLSDVSTSIVVILGFKSAKKEPDSEHPFGHGRAEYVATLIIAVLLALVGFSFIQQSIQRILNLEELSNVEYVFVIVALVLFSALIKELMARYSSMISKKINSDVLKADSWHHRSDALSSVGVAIGLIGARYGFLILDPIFGIIIAIIIIFVGVDLLKKTSNFLIGTSPDRDFIETIEKMANNTKGVLGIHDISLHDYGTTKVVTFHVDVNKTLLIDDAHDIADILEEKIKKTTGFLSIIHIEPEKQKLDFDFEKLLIEKILKNQKEIISFHKVNIVKLGDRLNVKMHLIVDKDMSVESTHLLNHRLKTMIEKLCHGCDIDIHFDPCIHECDTCDIYCTDKE